MQDIPEETCECRGGCGRSFTCNALASDGTYAFRTADLPPGWLVFDMYPPGDDGLGFACSAECFARWTGDDYAPPQ